MHQASVVPDDQITGLPCVLIDARRLTGVLHQFVQQRLRFRFAQAGNAVGMPAGIDGLATGFRVRLDERTQRR